MKQVHLKLKMLLCLVTAFVLIATQAAISQPTINNSAGPAPQLYNAPSEPIANITATPEQKTSISIYPNPATNNIVIQSSTTMHLVVIIDMLGKTIKQFQPDQFQSKINLDGLAPGRYFISIQQAENTEPVIRSFVKVQ